MRSDSHKQPRKTYLPALPSNTEMLLQQQKDKQLEHNLNNLKINTGPTLQNQNKCKFYLN